ncbi:MAG: hypothetical protein HC819_20970 [Cyclobacteriaceae bacterium]|nr:hypothetical protein [Cyclobacteriaceae bacterium]
MQSSPKTPITTQTYFEDHFYYLGWGLLLLSLPLLFIHWYFGVLSLGLGMIILTTAYKLIVDLKSKQIVEFLFFIGMKRNLERHDFEELNCISIRSGTYTQQLNYKSISSNIQGTMYSAYLETDSGSFYIGESKSLKKLKRKMQSQANTLGILVEYNE